MMHGPIHETNYDNCLGKKASFVFLVVLLWPIYSPKL